MLAYGLPTDVIDEFFLDCTKLLQINIIWRLVKTITKVFEVITSDVQHKRIHVEYLLSKRERDSKGEHRLNAL
jgi:hypothetical protein